MTVTFRDWLGQNRRRSAVFAMFADTPGAWTTAEELHAELHPARVDSRECVFLASAKDAWLGMTDQWEYDCADCGTDSTDERYMVTDQTWEASGMCPFGFLCVGCIEQRLGRRLTAADFLDLPLNRDSRFQRSERLTARLATST
ncbi:hypothetical protein OHB41_25945 [Streptomyces sp. NBC_01571]|uniref:hypothetical protein n=1 Tax=Streptomyces sp. NBC_01571 TaxID=2975883 RepID=UPI00225818C4|nr:hypothetical protein [Streptomyces sp. NBC_01571]MCX4576554.1 hypothetical protein [Streptomyces sp. NBC_01571]